MLKLKNKAECRWDVVSLGEVMLRFDPGERRIAQARSFDVWEGGGEYNVARGLSRCFGQRASMVTALVDNPVGRLVESLMLQGGVDISHVLWSEHDGIGREARNGVYFLERGFGVRGALGCMDRGHTAVSRIASGAIDWEILFGVEGTRWFHTGGIFCGLGEGCPTIAREAMEAARRHGTAVSFDCNYRPSLWKAAGGRLAAARVNRDLMPFVDVLFGHEGDLALDHIASSHGPPAHTVESYAAMAQRIAADHPGLSLIATATRRAASAGRNDWGGFAYAKDAIHEGTEIKDLEILDRVGGGDSFAAGVIHGLLQDKGTAWALACGIAHGALTMTTPGDSSQATLAEVERLMAGANAQVQR